MAYQSLSLRGFPSDVPDAGLIRIFREGQRLEQVVVDDLKAAGFDVLEIDPDTGGQWRFSDLGGHYIANLDGLVSGSVPTTLEIKSMNKAMFTALVKKGVAVSHPEYYDQVQAGMDLMRRKGKPVMRCMFVAINKENLAYHVEYVQFDLLRARALYDKAAAVITDNDSRRMSAYKEAWDCKRCFKRTACWEPDIPAEQRDCRMCKFSRPVEGRNWHCEAHGTSVPIHPCSSFQLFRPKASK